MKLLHLVVALAACAASTVGAREVRSSEFQAFMDLATGGTKHTVGMGTGGTPLVTSGVPGGTQMGNMKFAPPAPGGWPVATGEIKLPSPVPNKTLPVRVTQGFTKLSQSAALRGLAKGFFGPIGAGMAIYTLLDAFDLIPVWNPATKQYDYIQDVSGNQCAVHHPGFPTYTAQAMSCQAAAESVHQQLVAAGKVVSWYTVRCPKTSTSGFCYLMSGESVAAEFNTAFTPYESQRPVTDSELEQMLSPDKWANDVDPAPAIKEALERGATLQTAGAPDYSFVDGLNVIQSAPKVTTASDGATETTTTECLVTPNPAVTVIEFDWSCLTKSLKTTPSKTTTETVTTTKPDGTTETVVITKSTPGETRTSTETVTPEEVPVDTPLPDLPTLYEPKYPDGPAGVWSDKLAALKATPLFQLPTALAPDLGDSGGCPQWSVPLSVGLMNFGTGDASIPCNVWAFLRIFTIIGALFLARALIFGG